VVVIELLSSVFELDDFVFNAEFLALQVVEDIFVG